jgi:hypothetical protein
LALSGSVVDVDYRGIGQWGVCSLQKEMTQHGIDYRRDLPRIKKQIDRVRQTMLEATAEKEWLTLVAIEFRTGDPQASVSARLRDLRKLGFKVFRRRRTEGQWEYRIWDRAEYYRLMAIKRKRQ